MPAMAEHIERQTKQKDAIRTQLADCDEFISIAACRIQACASAWPPFTAS